MENLKMLTLDEAAKLIPGMTRNCIRRLCLSEELPCIKSGKKFLICEKVLIDYLTNPLAYCKAEKEKSRRT